MIDERVAVYLDAMKTAAGQAGAFVEGLSKEQFLADEKTKAALVMKLVQIGENAVKIEHRSPDFVAQHPEWPWVAMRGMRNRGVHGYEQLNFDVIWDTVMTAVPPLRELIRALGPLDPQ